MIRIQVPATSANLGSGFDSLGIALTLYNQIWMEEDDRLDISCKDSVVVPTDESNLIYWGGQAAISGMRQKASGAETDSGK